MARAPVLDVNSTDFPASCMVDFSQATGPAGKCGRVFSGTDGRLYTEDGSRVVFWGVNVAKDSIFQPREIIDKAVEAIAAAGFNLVRFHHFDDVTGLLPRERAGKKPRIDQEKLACLDYWIYKLGQRGIYVYLDLLDYRTFWPEEGVPDGERLGRGAKPYAFFLPRLIDLQAEYARELLHEHINPLTGRSYADDPAVLFVEICDENGLFRAARKGETLREPHASALAAMFTQWLRERYRTDEALRKAWTTASGLCALTSGESLAAGNIKPSLDGSGPRQADTALFFADLHRRYFTRLREAVAAGGRPLLVGAVTEPAVPADLRACAEALDFVGINWYWDHPRFLAGASWQMPYLYDNRNPLASDALDDFPVAAAAARVHGRPLVVREWSPCWPNKYRAAAMLEVAAFAALQDVDALILFHFSADPAVKGIGLFDVSKDPARWGVAAVAGQIFRQRLVRPARKCVIIGHSLCDLLAEPLLPMASPLHQLGYVCRVANAFFDDQLPQPEADLVVSSGRSATGKYPDRRVVLFSNSQVADPWKRSTIEGLDAANGCDVSTLPPVREAFNFGGTLFDNGQSVELAISPAYFLPDILNRPGLRPIGRGASGRTAYGVRDIGRNRYCYKQLPDKLSLRAALDALGQVTADPSLNHGMLDRARIVSDGGEIVVDRAGGVLLVQAPLVAAVAGDIGGKQLTAGPLRVYTDTGQGAIVWLSLDGKPADESTVWLIKMVTIAVNTGEQKRFVRRGATDVYMLEAAGSPPVSTLGHPGGRTVVVLDGRPVIALDLINGTWELVRERSYLYLWCDTPGSRIELPIAPGRVNVTEVRSGGATAADQKPQPLQYPSGVRLLWISPVAAP
ncbi:MAG: beta-galactosidase [Armatimonadetes bacterium]|nr:beta-galactosidase [Armatimonadota bacterium]